MKEQRHYILTKLKQKWMFTLFLASTLLFFAFKGISYLILGSYIPMIVILSIFILFFLSTYKSTKTFLRVLGLWSILLIIWASVRFLLGMINLFVKPIPEAHVDNQLGTMGLLISLFFLISGIYLWKFKKKFFKNEQATAT